MDKFNDLLKARWITVALLVVFCATSVSGCASLRKKFIRQKKEKDQTADFIPVLVPVEYPRPDTSPATVYKDHYTITKAYFRDLDDIIGSRNSSDKQQLYVLTQITSRMESMAEVLADGEKKTSLQQLVAKVKEVVAQYGQPEGVRRYDLIKSSVRHVEDKFFKTLKPALVQKDLKKTP